MNSKTHYVYTLSYPPIGEHASEVFYVGKGTKSRLFMHEDEAASGTQSRKCDIIRSIWSQGGQVLKTIVYSTKVEMDALVYEWVLINMVFPPGTLTNEKYAEIIRFSPCKRLARQKGNKNYQVLQLRSHRKGIGLSVEGLARRANISSRTVRNAEDGKKVSFDTAVQILQGLNSALADVGKSSVTIDDLGLIV